MGAWNPKDPARAGVTVERAGERPTSALPGRTTTLPPGLARYVSDAILTNADRVTL